MMREPRRPWRAAGASVETRSFFLERLDRPISGMFLERLDTPTGKMLIVTDNEDCLRAVDWQDCEHRLHRLLRLHYGSSAATMGLREGPRRPSTARGALLAYFDGDVHALTAVRTATNGTPFQRAVWDALRRIPVGCTISYRTLAIKIGRPTATRAVGLANGANPIAIVVPCHRVIGTNSSLTGYAGGLERKRWLLVHEGVRLA